MTSVTPVIDTYPIKYRLTTTSSKSVLSMLIQHTVSVALFCFIFVRKGQVHYDILPWDCVLLGRATFT